MNVTLLRLKYYISYLTKYVQQSQYGWLSKLLSKVEEEEVDDE